MLKTATRGGCSSKREKRKLGAKAGCNDKKWKEGRLATITMNFNCDRKGGKALGDMELMEDPVGDDNMPAMMGETKVGGTHLAGH